MILEVAAYLGTLVLLLTIAIGLFFLLRMSGGIGAFLAIMLFGTTGVGMLLVFSKAMDLPGLKDIALAIALLAGILGVVMVLRCWPEEAGD